MPKTREHVAEMRLLGDRELLERLSESRRELFNLRFQLATGQLDNSARLSLKILRKDVSRACRPSRVSASIARSRSSAKKVSSHDD